MALVIWACKNLRNSPHNAHCCESLHIVVSHFSLLWVTLHCCESSHCSSHCCRFVLGCSSNKSILLSTFTLNSQFVERKDEIYFQFNAGVTKRFPFSDLRRWIFMVRLPQWLCGDIIKETIESVLFTFALATLKPVTSTKNTFLEKKKLN